MVRKLMRWLSGCERVTVIARLAREESAKQGSAAMRVGAVFVDPRVWGFATVYSCGLTCFFGVNFWIPAIVQELGSMILAKVAHQSDGSGERHWHSALGLFACLAGLLLLAAAGHSPALSLLGLTLITVGNGCWIVTFWSLPAALLCGIAAGIAWINSVGNLGGHNSAPILSAVCATSTAAATARSFSCSPASRSWARSSCW